MIIPVLVIGVTTVLAIAAMAVSLFAVWRTKALTEWSDRHTRASLEALETALGAVQTAVQQQGSQLEHLEQQTAASAPAASVPRTGMNLCKRSQAIRMHRMGDRLEHIAATLEVPLQEVDLLIKVHRIVIGNLG